MIEIKELNLYVNDKLVGNFLKLEDGSLCFQFYGGYLSEYVIGAIFKRLQEHNSKLTY